ncbi:MAG: 2-oxo acid dehydrogenase subunit E2 [Alphaproteobacteria bacterium]|nr:2-oxo acid dehydrogenase subunit E2 [Alphaproteobacteria bacterium]MCB9792018.1 2-oxo acid dehydrogenase subunit E2 [Alphaproteobacteria bacterium]
MPNTVLKPYPHASSFRRMAAVAWDAPRDPTIYGVLEVRAESLLSWIDLKRRERDVRVTVTHAVVRALALTLQRYPDCNAVVRYGKPMLRRDVDVFAQVAIPSQDKVGSADLSGVCIRGADQKTVDEICEALRGGAKAIRGGTDKELQRTKRQFDLIPGLVMGPILRFMGFLQKTLNIDTGFLGAPRDPFGSAMVTSLGMMGINMAFAPFFPLGNAGVLVLVGSVEDKAVVEDGDVVPGKVLTLTCTLDHRVIDGYQAAKMAGEMRRLLENPRLLEGDAERARALGPADSTTDLDTLELDYTTQDRPTLPSVD